MRGGDTRSYVFKYRYAGESELRSLLHLDLREGLTAFEAFLNREGETRVRTFTKTDPSAPGDSSSSEQGYEEFTQEIQIVRPGQTLTIHRETHRSDSCVGCRQETFVLPVPGPAPGWDRTEGSFPLSLEFSNWEGAIVISADGFLIVSQKFTPVSGDTYRTFNYLQGGDLAVLFPGAPSEASYFPIGLIQ